MDHTVCDSNGMLHKSQCEFNKASCVAHASGETLSMVSYGACVDMTTSCDVVLKTQCMQHFTLTNPGYPGYPFYSGGTGHVITSGGTTLTDAGEKICGSDKNTYSNVCVFRHSQCSLQIKAPTATQLTLDHMGECQLDPQNATEIDCSQYISDTTSGLAVETGTNVQPVLTCPRNLHPVCSMEGRTFSNECSLCSYEIRMGKASTSSPTVSAYDGACRHHNIFG